MKLHEVPTPAYVIDEKKLRENLEVLRDVKIQAGCKILLAQKAFSAFCVYPLIAEYLDGCTASGLYETRLGREEFHQADVMTDGASTRQDAETALNSEAVTGRKENHVFSPAYKMGEIEEITDLCDHILLNSFSQLHQFGPVIKARREKLNLENALVDQKNAQGLQTQVDQRNVSEKQGNVSTGIGLRLNPECSTQDGHEIYDPCAPGSRLGITLANFEKGLLDYPDDFKLVEGLHFHTLCEQNSDDLETTVKVLEERFGKYLKLPQIKWLNMGGGHHITRKDYDREKLIGIVKHLKETYDVEVYLEPGEAIALNAGYLETTVLDTVENGITTLLLDTSAACHMPDVLEMPYRPPLQGSGEANEKAYTYRLSSCTCLAGDVIGDFSFDHEVKPGDRLTFEDMAIYSMVKNNTFNGMALPSIYLMHEDGECELVKEFGYEDFKMRLS